MAYLRFILSLIIVRVICRIIGINPNEISGTVVIALAILAASENARFVI